MWVKVRWHKADIATGLDLIMMFTYASMDFSPNQVMV